MDSKFKWLHKSFNVQYLMEILNPINGSCKNKWLRLKMQKKKGGWMNG